MQSSSAVVGAPSAVQRRSQLELPLVVGGCFIPTVTPCVRVVSEGGEGGGVRRGRADIWR